MTGIAIITGASRGIGRATAQVFLEKDWRVVSLSRSPCDVPGVLNIAIDFLECDWQDLAHAHIRQAVQGPQRICLVHNAAISQADTIQDLDIETLGRNLRVGLFAPLLLNQMLLPLMGQGSSIIYIGSTLSEKAVPGSASYVMTKHAVAGAMKATCQDLGESPNVHTCCLCPGFTHTHMLEDIFSEEGQMEALFDRVSQRRLIRPEEIGALVHFCAESPVVNGSVIHANLGQLEH
ncbi:MAG: SDR family oxidoreductase [Proteobacteria bacterium]|nr:SDR family oxidoreductase [Pseudomonadota bacterium]